MCNEIKWDKILKINILFIIKFICPITFNPHEGGGGGGGVILHLHS